MRVSPCVGTAVAHRYSPGLSPTLPNSATMSLCAWGAFPTVQWYGTSFETAAGALLVAILGAGAVWHPASAATPIAISSLSIVRTLSSRTSLVYPEQQE